MTKKEAYTQMMARLDQDVDDILNDPHGYHGEVVVCMKDIKRLLEIIRHRDKLLAMAREGLQISATLIQRLFKSNDRTSPVEWDDALATIQQTLHALDPNQKVGV